MRINNSVYLSEPASAISNELLPSRIGPAFTKIIYKHARLSVVWQTCRVYKSAVDQSGPQVHQPASTDNHPTGCSVINP